MFQCIIQIRVQSKNFQYPLLQSIFRHSQFNSYVRNVYSDAYKGIPMQYNGV